MPVSKRRKHPKKRTSPAINTAPSGYVANITHSGFNVCKEIKCVFHQDGRRYYNQGRMDKASGTQQMSYEEFMSKPIEPMPGFLSAFDNAIRESQFAQYVDGYEGRPFYDRVAFTREDI